MKGPRVAIGWTALALLAVACGDSREAGPDAGPVDSAAKNLGPGRACATNADCQVYGLTCYLINRRAGTGICSRGCNAEADCGGQTHCNAVGGVLICTPAGLCDPCKTSDDCGPDAPICVNPGPGPPFCSVRCNVGDGRCGAGFSCKQYGSRVDEFACRPAAGSCRGDGGQCSPCKTDADCKVEARCFRAEAGGERFCALECSSGSGSSTCPAGYGCASYGEQGYCNKIVVSGAKELLIPTCIAGSLGYCDACEEDWQCASGRCATKNGKKFCVQAKECTKQTEVQDCPYGGQATFCVPSDKGRICAPPPAYHCHGFKACLGHPCAGDERCIDGLCKPR